MDKVSAYAFFDVDETLIRVKSMFSFFRFWSLDYIGDHRLYSRFRAHFDPARSGGRTREKQNRDYYRFLAGADPIRLEQAGEIWADRVLREDVLVRPTVSMLQALKADGVAPVFVSGSFDEVLDPIARHLGVRHILATRMQISTAGYFTGEIIPPQTIGCGKAEALNAFLAEKSAEAEDCWAFGDDVSDIPMLEAVGHPVAVGDNEALLAVANDRGWSVMRRQAYAS